MVWAGRIIRAVIGFAVGVYIGEVVWASESDWTNVPPFVLAVVGWLVGTVVGRRLRSRTVTP